MEEEWKFYKETKHTRWGYRVYEVSNLGNVKMNGELFNPPNRGVYKVICNKYLHRIVAELFIPNPANKPCVDHIDTNPANNSASNLRWVTHKENNDNQLTKQHYSEALSGRVLSAEWKQKISEANKGKSLSEDTRQKMSAVKKEYWKNKHNQDGSRSL